MGNSCKHCSCNENNKNTIEMNTENDQIKHDDLVLLSNRIISTDSAGKVNLTSDDKINEYKYLK